MKAGPAQEQMVLRRRLRFPMDHIGVLHTRTSCRRLLGHAMPVPARSAAWGVLEPPDPGCSLQPNERPVIHVEATLPVRGNKQERSSPRQQERDWRVGAAEQADSRWSLRDGVNFRV